VSGYEEFPNEIFLRAPATSDLVSWYFTYIKIIHKAPHSSRLFCGLVLKAIQQTIVACVLNFDQCSGVIARHLAENRCRLGSED